MPFSPDTEVLTLANGWKFIKDLTTNDAIAVSSYTSDNQVPIINYSRPCYIEPLDYNGVMCHLQNEHLNIFITEDHPMWCGRSQDTFRLMPAIEVLGSPMYYMKVGVLPQDLYQEVNALDSIARITMYQNDLMTSNWPIDRLMIDAFHVGYYLDIFIDTSVTNRNRKSVILETQDKYAYYDIFNIHAFYTFTPYVGPVYNLNVGPYGLVYARRHGRACWIGI